jgi:hypothetical protein
MTWDGSDFVCPNRGCGEPGAESDDGMWFSFAGPADDRVGDGELTEVTANGVAFAFGDPSAIEDTIGIPRGALQR